jgi:hypothetical protein
MQKINGNKTIILHDSMLNYLNLKQAFMFVGNSKSLYYCEPKEVFNSFAMSLVCGLVTGDYNQRYTLQDILNMEQKDDLLDINIYGIEEFKKMLSFIYEHGKASMTPKGVTEFIEQPETKQTAPNYYMYITLVTGERLGVMDYHIPLLKINRYQQPNEDNFKLYKEAVSNILNSNQPLWLDSGVVVLVNHIVKFEQA